MQVTEVKLSLRYEEMVRAYADITLDDCFVIRGLRIIHSSRGYLVAMPNRKRPDGMRVDIAHPITPQTRRMIEDAVMAEYRKATAEPGGSTGDKQLERCLQIPLKSRSVDPDGAGSSGARLEIVCLGDADYKTAS